MADERQDLIDLIYLHPTEIARRLGYDKLTELHDAWIRAMVFGDDDETLQAHRGSYKTTCIAISLALIILLFPEQRTIFMRKTDTDVAEVLAATSNVLKSAYFRSMCQTRCGGSLTGKHADRVFTDDIINIKDRVSAAERNRIKLIYQELQNIKNRGGRIFNTGTPWHKDDAFSLMPNIVKYDCYSTGLIDRDELAKIERSMSVSLFAANYKLKHIADEEAMFKEPRYFSDPRELHDGIGHIDAAYGGKDGTAFTALAKTPDGWRAYIRLWPEKHVDDCLPEILRLCKELRIGTIFCEKNADKGYLRKRIIRMGHPCRGYTENQNKFIKVSTYLRAEWADLRLLDCDAYPLDAEAVNQVLDYNENAEHDDMPDSLASAIRAYGQRPQIRGFKEGV